MFFFVQRLNVFKHGLAKPMFNVGSQSDYPSRCDDRLDYPQNTMKPPRTLDPTGKYM